MKFYFYFAFLLLFGFLFSCSIDSQERISSRKNYLRPDNSAYLNGYGNVTLRSWDSQEGNVRVWWATTGVHTPLAGDTNKNGTPDFVEKVSEVAEKVISKLQDVGFRVPLSDKIVGQDPTLYGGNERFDIYLMNFTAGDGKYNKEYCVSQGKTKHCSGYFVLENDFHNGHYKSTEEAIQVVVSHEMFHAVQASYIDELPGWVSEGSATWFEELFYFEQSDFEGFTRIFFQNPERSLFSRQLGPSDSYAYSTGLFFYFLEKKHSLALLKDFFEELAKGEETEKALENVLKKASSSLQEAFETFALWNGFTESFSVKNFGYPFPSRFTSVKYTLFQENQQLNWSNNITGMSSLYAYQRISRPMSVALVKSDGFELSPCWVASASWIAKGKAPQLLTKSGEKIVLDPVDSPFMYIATNGTTTDKAFQIQVRNASVATTEENKQEPSLEPNLEKEGIANLREGTTEKKGDASLVDVTSDTNEPSSGCHCQTTSSSFHFLWLFFIVFVGLWGKKRRN